MKLLHLSWVLLAAFFVLYAYEPNTPRFSAGAAMIDLGLVMLGGVQFLRAAAAAPARLDRIWYRISIGLFIWCIAILLRLFEMALDQPGYGTLADAFWVVGYLPVFSGFRLWHTISPSSTKFLRGIALFAVFSCIVVYFFFLHPLIQDPTRRLVLKALDIYYYVMNFCLLGMIIIPSLQPGAWGARIWWIALVVFLGSDLVFSYWGTDPTSRIYKYLDIPYCVGDFLLACAGGAQWIVNTQKDVNPLNRASGS